MKPGWVTHSGAEMYYPGEDPNYDWLYKSDPSRQILHLTCAPRCLTPRASPGVFPGGGGVSLGGFLPSGGVFLGLCQHSSRLFAAPRSPQTKNQYYNIYIKLLSLTIKLTQTTQLTIYSSNKLHKLNIILSGFS